MTTVFRMGRIFVPTSSLLDDTQFADCMIIKDGQISYVGPDTEAPPDATVIDLDNRVVVPGFIDAHVHILHYGLSLRKLNLTECTSLEQIREAIKSYAQSNPGGGPLGGGLM